MDPALDCPDSNFDPRKKEKDSEKKNGNRYNLITCNSLNQYLKIKIAEEDKIVVESRFATTPSSYKKKDPNRYSLY